MKYKTRNQEDIKDGCRSLRIMNADVPLSIMLGCNAVTNQILLVCTVLRVHACSTTQKLLRLSPNRTNFPHSNTCHLPRLLEIDWHLLSTLEPDLLLFVSVWYWLCRAYFRITSPGRQLHPDAAEECCPLSFSLSLCEFIDGSIVILGPK